MFYIRCLSCSTEGHLQCYTSDSSTEAVQNFDVQHQRHVGFHIYITINKKTKFCSGSFVIEREHEWNL
jgi:hypothetical protein